MALQSRLLLPCILGANLALALAGQSGRPGSGRPPINPGSGGSGGRATTPPTTSQPSTGQTNDGRRLLYLTGMVMLEDGLPPPEAVTIEVSCGGRTRPYGVTDAQGLFSVNFGQPDAYTTADSGSSDRPIGGANGNSSGNRGTASPMIGCELNARLPGFRSDSIQLGDRRQLDNPSLGTIILHRLANVKGYTYSMTTMNAPPRAQKEYEKGIEASRKSKWPEAEALFLKAVTAYPKYAICWEALGRTYEVEKRLADAEKAYQQSIQADPRFVTPHMRLMILFGQDHRWEEVAKSAATVLQLDPYSYPIAYYINGIANLNLKHAELAEKDIREGLKVDPHGTVPRLNQLMGTILIEKKAYAEALPYLKAYLQNQPSSTDAEEVKSAIAHAEKMAGLRPQDTP
jgi:tetratricopeptide (TPR) repeat protein